MTQHIQIAFWTFQQKNSKAGDERWGLAATSFSHDNKKCLRLVHKNEKSIKNFCKRLQEESKGRIHNCMFRRPRKKSNLKIHKDFWEWTERTEYSNKKNPFREKTKNIFAELDEDNSFSFYYDFFARLLGHKILKVLLSFFFFTLWHVNLLSAPFEHITGRPFKYFSPKIRAQMRFL